ncbi:GDSL-type esterase/lipase family protein [Tomitella fengzijianii]|uniref:SGNH/GDSL hydrolase family protein n=1 Tax=Tomitella fengzijianii TaxID=2597660 RepID=A0A516X3X0_9ACTN|nr:GDSL-type esterase/lipase family protein [Tomitella fengzijianii]QDQ97760.1 SGNH/GDSL hydrolase family protein [Tomitella fengzijianii]
MSRVLRRSVIVVAWIVLIVGVAAGAIAAALWLTPMQQVSAAGQTVRVGVTAPSWSLSGPGELDLFGQRIATAIDFAGPVRPRLALDRITMGAQLSQFVGDPAAAAGQLQDALVDGWKRFFVWQVVVAGAAALVLFGALAGWARRGWRRSVALIVVGLVVTEGLNLGAIMVTAYSAPEKLRQVDSLTALTGAVPLPEVTGPPRPTGADVSRVAVIGDSTAAGLGNPPVQDPTPADTACGRSRNAFAVSLASADGWDVTNLACSGATIRAGLLGPQEAGGMALPPQVSADAVTRADLVVVSIGANDVNWSWMLRLCAGTGDCASSALQAYYQQQLADFSQDLLQLSAQLQQLPRHPAVIINEYYDPFSGGTECLKGLGVTDAKVDALQDDLDALNQVLSKAAAAAGFRTASPDFDGHGVCSAQPYVQGVDDPAPFHPTASGQLVIALAVEQALRTAPGG